MKILLPVLLLLAIPASAQQPQPKGEGQFAAGMTCNSAGCIQCNAQGVCETVLDNKWTTLGTSGQTASPVRLAPALTPMPKVGDYVTYNLTPPGVLRASFMTSGGLMLAAVEHAPNVVVLVKYSDLQLVAVSTTSAK